MRLPNSSLCGKVARLEAGLGVEERVRGLPSVHRALQVVEPSAGGLLRLGVLAVVERLDGGHHLLRRRWRRLGRERHLLDYIYILLVNVKRSMEKVK